MWRFVRERGEVTAGGGVAVQLLEGGGKNRTSQWGTDTYLLLHDMRAETNTRIETKDSHWDPELDFELGVELGVRWKWESGGVEE